jgi:hypothetical protein
MDPLIVRIILSEPPCLILSLTVAGLPSFTNPRYSIVMPPSALSEASDDETPLLQRGMPAEERKEIKDALAAIP